MQVTSKPVLKDVYTNSLYQSKFMPIFERAETKIKELIFAAFLFGRSKYFLLLSIAQVINDVSKKIPETLVDRDAYLRGLQNKSMFMVKKYYDDSQAAFKEVREKLIGTIPDQKRFIQIRTPKEAVDLIQSKKLWSEAKGYPNVVNYPKEVKVRLNQLAQEPITTYEPGKKPISLWQKAELDVRYEHQMQNLQNLRVEGVELAWTSSHPNASKRCAPYQGKLMALEGHATMSNFRIKKVDGHWVYSLVDIMAQTDKYGYHNNIICGFNCRHRLIPYKPGTVAPKEFSKEELDQQRQIEANIREMERTIRLKKKQLALYNELGDKIAIKNLKAQINKLVAHYKAYCEKYGYAWYQYRIEV